MPLLIPYIARRERPHGQGFITYGEVNTMLTERVAPQESPEPVVRQGEITSRPSRRQVVSMSTRPQDWNSGFDEQFIPYAHPLTKRLMPAGRVLDVRAQNSVGIRPNIDRPTTAAYGSLFTLSDQNYDVLR